MLLRFPELRAGFARQLVVLFGGGFKHPLRCDGPQAFPFFGCGFNGVEIQCLLLRSGAVGLTSSRFQISMPYHTAKEMRREEAYSGLFIPSHSSQSGHWEKRWHNAGFFWGGSANFCFA
ncbi:hypothetical protein IAD21_00236 [Abditibacteriota bacterium]|nr:hypothetical protein IAD21_00236 [Abditibacteriota bacterium]